MANSNELAPARCSAIFTPATGVEISFAKEFLRAVSPEQFRVEHRQKKNHG